MSINAIEGAPQTWVLARGGKGRPSAHQKIKTNHFLLYWGPFCDLNFFYMGAFLLRFSHYDGSFSPCRGLFATLYSMVGGLFCACLAPLTNISAGSHALIFLCITYFKYMGPLISVSSLIICPPPPNIFWHTIIWGSSDQFLQLISSLRPSARSSVDLFVCLQGVFKRGGFKPPPQKKNNSDFFGKVNEKR